MAFDMSHVKLLVSVTYPSVFNELPTQIYFTRAFFADCFKGVRTELRKSVEKNKYFSQSDFPKGIKLPSFRTPKTPVEKQSPPSPCTCYTSPHSAFPNSKRLGSDSSSTGQSQQTGGIASQDEFSLSDNQESYELILQQMRSLGLPTAFGHPKKRYATTMTTKNQQREWAASVDDLDALFLNSLQPNEVLRQSFYSLSDIHSASSLLSDPSNGYDDNFGFGAPCILAAVFRVLGHSFCLQHSWVIIPRDLNVKLPESWSHSSLTNAKRAIRFSLSSGQCQTFNYVPSCAIPSREYVSQQALPVNLQQDEESVISMEKYWAQRYRLFSRFDRGIQFDRAGLFSVTPEVIALHHARRIANLLDKEPSSHTVLELFTGVGGNCIQLAVVGFNVVTVDISETMLQMAKVNAAVYGVEDRITFVRANAFTFLREQPRQFSAVFASPPWGGPTYSSNETFSLSSLNFSVEDDICHNFLNLLEGIASVTLSRAPVVLFLPRNTNAGQLFELHKRFTASAVVDVIPQLECELALIHGKPKGISIYLYYGNQWDEEDRIG